VEEQGSQEAAPGTRLSTLANEGEVIHSLDLAKPPTSDKQTNLWFIP